MGNKNTKSTFRNAIIYLNISADPVGAHNDKFWSQIFAEEPAVALEVIRSISIQEIRMLRDGSPRNFATLIYKMVERLCLATGTLCNTSSQQTAVLNSTRILIRIMPCAFEDDDWRDFFEKNQLCTASELREEPRLVYVEKDAATKDYVSYLPVILASKPGAPPPAVGLPAKPETLADGKSAADKNLLDDDDPVGPAWGVATSSLGELNDKTNLLGCQEDEDSALELIEELTKGPPDPGPHSQQQQQPSNSLLSSLVQSICDLLFCPEFTVLSHDTGYLANAVDAPPEDLKSLATCDYVWEPGVGFDSSVNSTTHFDRNRAELLRLLLACLSSGLYQPAERSMGARNSWFEWFVSRQNRHALPLFTSFLNVSLAYKPSISLPALLPGRSSRSLFVSDREELVELCLQLLIATLDYSTQIDLERPASEHNSDERPPKMSDCNSFADYLARIHRDEDFDFLVGGFARLLGTRLELAGYLVSKRPIEFEQELLILFWKICNLNQRFVQHLLKSNEILKIIVPLLYHMNENFQDPSRTALIHICVFNLLILSGERNFGVKLNKAYASKLLDNLPDFAGTHADLLIVVFHKLIMYGHDINQLYDYLMTIVANISPYLKNLSLLSAKCLIQLFETFSSVYVLFTEPFYHSMVVFLLEIFNNIIQYQFDGNSNLVYMILVKRELFVNLANLSTSQSAIDKILRKLIKRKRKMQQLTSEAEAGPAAPAEREAAPTAGGAKSDPARETVGGQSRRPCEQQDNSLEPGEQAPKLHSLQENNGSLSCASASSSGTATNNIRRQNLATVSASSPQAVNGVGQQFFKQEVSLVETPDLNHVTRPIHPYDPFCTLSSADPVAEQPLGQQGKSANEEAASAKRATLNLVDDLLDEKFEGLGWPATFGSGQEADEPNSRLTFSDCSSKQSERGQQAAPTEALDGATCGRAEKESSPTASSSKLVGNEDYGTRKWKPTSAWLRQWKQTLPLQTVLRTIEVLVPQIEQMSSWGCHSSAGAAGSLATVSPGQDEAAVIKFLQSGTLVGLLPVPHPILIRRYRTNNGRSILWFRSYTWAIIYVRNSIWTGTHIKLIKPI